MFITFLQKKVMGSPVFPRLFFDIFFPDLVGRINKVSILFIKPLAFSEQVTTTLPSFFAPSTPVVLLYLKSPEVCSYQGMAGGDLEKGWSVPLGKGLRLFSCSFHPTLFLPIPYSLFEDFPCAHFALELVYLVAFKFIVDPLSSDLFASFRDFSVDVGKRCLFPDFLEFFWSEPAVCSLFCKAVCCFVAMVACMSRYPSVSELDILF